MNTPQSSAAYDKIAGQYADAFFDELSKKPFDRMLLTAFASKNKGKGRMIDFGCGPGQTTRFLQETGVKEIVGTDLSPVMIEKAKALSPALDFETADLLNLYYPDQSFGSALAFYAIVHFTEAELKKAFSEISRVLKTGAEFLFAFHVGTETIHRDELFDVPVNLDFHFFLTEDILKLVHDAGFELVDAVERFPYPAVEHPSKRAYVWVRKV